MSAAVVTAEMIERAARVLFLHDYETGRDWSFDQSTEQEREAYRETARAMFAAASMVGNGDQS